MSSAGSKCRVALWSGIAGFALSLAADVVRIQLPPETGTFQPAPGPEMANAQLANAQCLTCHSVEYVRTQPPMPLAFWTAEVKKMREKYAAPVPEEDIPGLANYLARNYGTDTNLPAVPAPVPGAGASPGGGLSQSAAAEAFAANVVSHK